MLSLQGMQTAQPAGLQAKSIWPCSLVLHANLKGCPQTVRPGGVAEKLARMNEGSFPSQRFYLTDGQGKFLCPICATHHMTAKGLANSRHMRLCLKERAPVSVQWGELAAILEKEAAASVSFQLEGEIYYCLPAVHPCCPLTCPCQLTARL